MANRERGGAFTEPSVPIRAVAGQLAAELGELARWLEIEAIDVSDRGNAALYLRRALP